MHPALDFTVQCVYIRDSETVLSYICLQTGNASTIIYIQLLLWSIIVLIAAKKLPIVNFIHIVWTVVVN